MFYLYFRDVLQLKYNLRSVQREILIKQDRRIDYGIEKEWKKGVSWWPEKFSAIAMRNIVGGNKKVVMGKERK